ncbi:unnamed protein product [Miscanthus lutarioriparius]|uniref:Uncharacterized protein n=1 Tax=Miscanthus lutarioriparius TaxID=422564 RepID=A0A811PC21_9POAL|nr:unnamed protein product [Miscanthus lutarioriparius]
MRVIANEFCKSLCLRICLEVASFTRAVEVSESPPVPALAAPASESSHDAEKDHRIYSNLGGALISSKSKPFVDCILDCIGASSTDHFPAERMENTLDPREVVGHRPSYWSSGGQYDPDVPESLTYRLRSNLCIVDEIRIHPYKVFFYDGQPIFSSKMVRVRIGRSKPSRGMAEVDNQTVIADENYVWTYTSPDFPMRQVWAMPVASCPLWSSTELGSKSSSHADGVHQEPAQMEH